jgi:hypothetical protein
LKKIKATYEITLLSVCLCLPPQQAGIVEPEETAVARQRLGKYVFAATNTQATTEELLDAVISMPFVSYQTPNM